MTKPIKRKVSDDFFKTMTVVFGIIGMIACIVITKLIEL